MKQVGRLLWRIAKGAWDRSPWSVTRRFSRVPKAIHKDTPIVTEKALRGATETIGYSASPSGHDPQLERLLQQFANKWDVSGIRWLVQVPEPSVSIAARSIASNLLQTLAFMGAGIHSFGESRPLNEKVLGEFQPNIVSFGSHEYFVRDVDWKAIKDYRQTHPLLIGVTAPSFEASDREVSAFVRWAQEKEISFLYDYSAPEFFDQRHPLLSDADFEMVSLEHSANPLAYFPIPGINRDVDYVFLGSGHGSKRLGYLRYFKSILENRPGVLVGAGWGPKIPISVPLSLHACLYARARVGLNLHIPNQFKYRMQLNERLFNLAAAGVPQLVDRPRLLMERFPEQAFFSARNPREFRELFAWALSDPTEAQRRADVARTTVLERFTMLHVADRALTQLQALMEN